MKTCYPVILILLLLLNCNCSKNKTKEKEIKVKSSDTSDHLKPDWEKKMNFHPRYWHTTTDLGKTINHEFKYSKVDTAIESYEVNLDKYDPVIWSDDEGKQTIYLDYKNQFKNKNRNYDQRIYEGTINKKLPQYGFIIDVDTSRDIPLSKYIEVFRADTTSSIQILKVTYAEGYGGDEFFQIIDMNFDGYNDIRLYSSAGATGNIWYNSWLYSPTMDKFLFNKPLSEFSAVQFDTVNKVIKTYYRLGGDGQSVNYYKWYGNRLINISEILSQRIDGFKYLRIVRRLIDGKMVVVYEEICEDQIEDHDVFGIYYE